MRRKLIQWPRGWEAALLIAVAVGFVALAAIQWQIDAAEETTGDRIRLLENLARDH